MGLFRVREVRLLEDGSAGERAKCTSRIRVGFRRREPAAAEEVRHFFEVEILSLKAPQKIDFDALVVVNSKGIEVARFTVSDVWKREADAVDTGKTYLHWV